MYTRVVVLVATLLISCASGFAHVGGHGSGPLRTWRWNDGARHHMHGSFHSVRDGDVVVEDAQGRLRALPMGQLSVADREVVQSAINRLEALREPMRVQPDAQPTATLAPRELPHRLHLLAMGCVIAAVLGAAVLATKVLRMTSVQRRLRVRLAACAMLACVMALAPSVEAGLSAVMVGTDPATIDASFAPFKPRVATRWDATYFYVEHDGMPMDMPAMKGITAWQQQVPIPQNYVGTNAWSIPLMPLPASKPISLDTALHTGAVALAVNGLPIFNPENNRGEFSYEIGELDAFGGHCGRADDYHYHIAPVHLAERLGSASPIAWALDGYPLYAYKEPDGSNVAALDANLGHEWNGGYHYHATTTRPYMLAAMRGQITIDKDQVVPQARAQSVRPFLQPLQGAEITDMHQCDANHYALKYSLKGSVYWVNYRWNAANAYTYVMVAPDGTRSSTSYQRK